MIFLRSLIILLLCFFHASVIAAEEDEDENVSLDEIADVPSEEDEG